MGRARSRALVGPRGATRRNERADGGAAARGHDGLLDVVQEELLDGDVVVRHGDEAELVGRVAAVVELARLDEVEHLAEAPRGLGVAPVWKSTTGLGRPDQPLKFSSSVKSKSIRLIFGRIDCSRRVLEAQRTCVCQNVRTRSH